VAAEKNARVRAKTVALIDFDRAGEAIYSVFLSLPGHPKGPCDELAWIRDASPRKLCDQRLKSRICLSTGRYMRLNLSAI
jgi:hypothetical protein